LKKLGDQTTVKKIGLFVKTDDEAVKKADEFEAWLRSKDIHVVRKESVPPNSHRSGAAISHAPQDLFCVFVLGGDGTFLSAVRWIGNHPIPVHGIKFGDVGFLAETAADRLFSAAENILDGKYATEPRMRLVVKVIRKDSELISEAVLNDVVINKGALAKLANIETFIDDHYLTTYRADGLIVATPTGSTAYSLAAGGPIIQPSVPGIIITPISPFTLTIRPLILPDSVRISIRLAEKTTDVMLTFDGQSGFEINDQDTIVVEKGSQPVNMMILPDHNYFDVLKAKLRWSGGRG
jgi:NAD+ kinase